MTIFWLHEPVCASFAVKALSLLDPHDICVQHIAAIPDLYWSIIWYHGSVHKALKEIGRYGFGTPGLGEDLNSQIYNCEGFRCRSIVIRKCGRQIL